MTASHSDRPSKRDIRRRTEVLHKAAGETGDDFLEYLFGMALLYLDAQARGGNGRRVASPAAGDPQIEKAAKLLNGKTREE